MIEMEHITLTRVGVVLTQMDIVETFIHRHLTWKCKAPLTSAVLAVSLSELLSSDDFSNPTQMPPPGSLRVTLEQVRPSFLSVMQISRDWPLFI